MAAPGPSAKFSHIFVLGLAIKLGGCVAAWHNGFKVGVWGFFIACLLVGIGYTMLNLCVAEITSIIVFPGGHFGYVRASLGPFWGYMAGMMGLVESVFLVAVSMLKVSQALDEVFGFDKFLVILFWWMGYLLFMGIHLRGGAALWQFTFIATAVTVVSLLIYLFGSVYFVQINHDAYRHSMAGFQGDTVDVLSALRLPCWFFVGIDLLPAISEEVINAAKVIPFAVLSVMGVMLVVSIWLQLVVAGLEPEVHSQFYRLQHVFPLSYGFGLIFDISQRMGTVFAIAPSFLSSFGFMYVAGRQVNAMARSGLLPKILTRTYGSNNTPIGGMLVVSAVALLALFIAWYLDPYTLLFRIAISGSCIVYILVLLSFIKFRNAYSAMARQFTNPLGVPSAIIGILCFALIEISVLFIYPIRQDFHQTIGFLVYAALCVVYYWTVVVKTQSFSEDEQKIFMRAYIINANNKMKRSIKSRTHPHLRKQSVVPYPLTPTPTSIVRHSSKLENASTCTDETALNPASTAANASGRESVDNFISPENQTNLQALEESTDMHKE